MLETISVLQAVLAMSVAMFVYKLYEDHKKHRKEWAKFKLAELDATISAWDYRHKIEQEQFDLELELMREEIEQKPEKSKPL